MTLNLFLLSRLLMITQIAWISDKRATKIKENRTIFKNEAEYLADDIFGSRLGVKVWAELLYAKYNESETKSGFH